MFVTGRQAATMLGVSRPVARRVLYAGLAGEPITTPGAELYEESRVRDLAEREPVAETDLPAACAGGVLVARVRPRQAGLDPAELAAGPWPLGIGGFLVVAVDSREREAFPLVMTVGPYIWAGLDVVKACGLTRRGEVRLGVREAGDWFEAFAGRTLHTPAGPALMFWRCPRWRTSTRRTALPWP